MKKKTKKKVEPKVVPVSHYASPVADITDLKHHELCSVVSDLLDRHGLSIYRELTPDYTAIHVVETGHD